MFVVDVCNPHLITILSLSVCMCVCLAAAAAWASPNKLTDHGGHL